MVVTAETPYHGCSGPFSITGHTSMITQGMSYQFVLEGLLGMPCNLTLHFSEGVLNVMNFCFLVPILSTMMIIMVIA